MLLVSYHERIQDFLSGGSRPDGQKTAWTLFFSFLVHSLLHSLQKGTNGFIAEKTMLSQGSRGGPTFSGGGGLNANFYRNPYNL